jgi:PAS domain S-box-containing protein
MQLTIEGGANPRALTDGGDIADDRERSDALERARAELERAARRVGLLQGVTAALSAALDPAEVADVVVSRVQPLLEADFATIRIVAGGRLEALAARGAIGGKAVSPSLAAPRPTEHAVARGEPVWIESRADRRAWFPEADAATAEAWEAMAVVPLASRGRVLGALKLVFGAPRRFDLEDRALILAVAEQCAQALDRALLFDAERARHAEARRATERLVTLQAVTSALSQARTVEDVASVMVLQANQALRTDGGAAYLRAGDRLELAATLGRAPDRGPGAALPLDAPLPAAVVVRTGVPVFLADRAELVAAFPALGAAPGTELVRAIAAVPLRWAGETRGSLSFEFAEPRPFGEADRALIAAMAEQFAQALERARLFDAERAARAEVERSRALLDALFASAPIGIAYLDRDLRFVRLNRLLADMNGLPVEAHLGRTPRDVLPGVPVDEVEAAFRRVLETGEPLVDVPLSGETPAMPGKTRHWLESWYPVRAGGAIEGIGVLVREVTAEREAQEFQRNVLGIVGHDLRNPLAAVITSATLLQRSRLTPDQARLGGRIVSGARRMERIASVLLDYARARAGQPMPLERRACHVAELARAVRDECEASHPGREIRVHGAGDGGAEWDPDRIAQVLANLVSNALDYSPPATSVEIAWDGGADVVRIDVANAGDPIPADVQPVLFEPFRRARPAGRDGLGLGLFIARAIVEAHGGRISVRSEAGSGTVFTVMLPRRAAA